VAGHNSSPMRDGKGQRWWGEYRLDEGAHGSWQLGALRLWVRRDRHDWHLVSGWDAGGNGVVVRVPSAEPPPEAGFHHHFGIRAPAAHLGLAARLPDRPLVWRPAQALSIAPHEEITLYLRTPLWLALQMGGEAALWETPLRRLSDTWFGSPTEAGGDAYSADREVLFELDDAHDPLHAITPIVIRNSASALLHLERLNLPVPFLSLFVDEMARVWTQQVTLERDEEDEELALLRIGKGAPMEAGYASLLAGPRVEEEKHLMFQAFSRLFR